LLSEDKPESDYGWLPAWGIVTNNTIQELVQAGKKDFKMKDGSTIRFCTINEIPQLPWVIDNPGNVTRNYHSEMILKVVSCSLEVFILLKINYGKIE
jgi:hypothetical protein